MKNILPYCGLVETRKSALVDTKKSASEKDLSVRLIIFTVFFVYTFILILIWNQFTYTYIHNLNLFNTICLR